MWMGIRTNIIMKFEEDSTRDILPVTVKETELIIEGLDILYRRTRSKLNRHHTKHNFKEDAELSSKIAKVQETLQYVTLIYNIRTNKLNPAVAESGGISIEATIDNTGTETLPRTEGA
jgi:hypothetical protein